MLGSFASSSHCGLTSTRYYDSVYLGTSFSNSVLALNCHVVAQSFEGGVIRKPQSFPLFRSPNKDGQLCPS